MREPQLGIAVGKRGIGKTHTTLQILNEYILGFGVNAKPRKVLILDVNDEFENIKAMKLKDVKLFTVHPKVEARRIRPYLEDGQKMTLEDICVALYHILANFKGGLLLIEDINKYLTHHFPKDVVGAIVTNRHADLDIIMHYQAIGKIPITVWENCNWIRFHKNNQGVDRHKKKFEDKYELLKIAECMIDYQYENGNKRFFLFCDIDNMKIKGKITQAMAEKGVEDYMTYNYKDVVAKEVRRIGLDGKKAYKNTEEASRRIKARLLKDYFATN